MIATLRHSLSTSDRPVARAVRQTRRAVLRFTLPAASGLVARPAMRIVEALRCVLYFFYRVLVCEPVFRASCHSCGSGVRTDVYIHWIQGRGRLIVGNDVLVDGKCSFTFASRYTPAPTLVIGDHSGIGHGCRFVVGKQIAIGRHCRIAGEVWMFDSSGHPLDAEARRAGHAASSDDVRPITVGDNVWIGARAIIHPGVTVGDHSVISAGAVVMADVPAYAVVAGNPARAVMTTNRHRAGDHLDEKRLRA
jgi:acetyltransferase-like isoleucine patch superfamily enzyme